MCQDPWEQSTPVSMILILGLKDLYYQDFLCVNTTLSLQIQMIQDSWCLIYYCEGLPRLQFCKRLHEF